jgi:diguanylate cyclase (GGDEF)-like protein
VTGGGDRDSPRDRSGLRPVLVALAAVVVAAGWLIGRPSSGIALANLGGTVALSAAAVACHRVSRALRADHQLGGFWRLWSYSAAALVVSTVSAMIRLGLGDPGLLVYEMVPTLASLTFSMGAFRHVPLTRRRRTDWIRLALDGAALAVAGVVFFGHVVLDLVPPSTPVATRWAAAMVGVGCLLGLVVFGKAAVNPEGRVDPEALAILAAGPVVGMVLVVLFLGGTEMGTIVLSVLGYPLVGLAVCGAAYRQARVHRAGARGPQRRPADSLQYLAIAVIAGLVIAVSAWNLSPRAQSVIVGAVLIAAILAARQLLSLRENIVALRGIRRQQAELERLALTDALTGLPSRTGFGLALAERLAADRPAGVLMIDIDDFKDVNDTLGPAAADQLLHQVGQLLQAACGPDELAARLGGDEFAVLMPVADPVAAEKAAARFQRTISRPLRTADQQLLLHASVGVAVAAAGEGADEVLRNADIAMYAAKESGKAAWVRFEPRMRQDMADHARMAGELHDAVVRGELRLFYQPVYDLRTGRMEGGEALIRWQHPTRGFVSPGEFIPVAERSGLIVPVGAWELREACEQLARWRAGYGPEAIEAINVNVAVRQLREASFVDEVAAVLSETGLTSRNLILEVTESSVVDGREVQATLQALHEMGVRLALDDFGTGQSSLSLLRAFPVDVLKLDKSFVDGVADGADKGRLAVAAAVAQLAEAFGLKTVAEGIEDEQQLARLREMGYRYGQGFLMARPLPADAYGALLAEGRALTYRP